MYRNQKLQCRAPNPCGVVIMELALGHLSCVRSFEVAIDFFGRGWGNLFSCIRFQFCCGLRANHGGKRHATESQVSDVYGGRPASIPGQSMWNLW